MYDDLKMNTSETIVGTENQSHRILLINLCWKSFSPMKMIKMNENTTFDGLNESLAAYTTWACRRARVCSHANWILLRWNRPGREDERHGKTTRRRSPQRVYASKQLQTAQITADNGKYVCRALFPVEFLKHCVHFYSTRYADLKSFRKQLE